MKRYFFIMMLLIFITGSAVKAEEIKKGETITLDRCLKIALENQPVILAAMGSVNLSSGILGQVKSAYYPQLNYNAAYDRYKNGNSNSGSTGTFNQYQTGFSVTQNLYDFGRTSSSVAVQENNLKASRTDFEATRETIILNVSQAYYGVLNAKRSVTVADEIVKDNKQHLDQAKGFYSVGTVPKYDVTTAEVNLSNAQLSLIQAQNTLKIAFVNLNNAMGMPAAAGYDIKDNLSYQKYEISQDEALRKSYVQRPDLMSAESRVTAAEQGVNLARAAYYPTLAGTGEYDWAGQDFPLKSGWTFGAALVFPLFNGFSTKYQVQQAKSSLDIAKANFETVRQTVMLQVEQAYLNLQNAEQQIPTAEIALQQAKENLDIANGRYKAGVGSPVEVTDAEATYASAETAYNQALYNYKIAQANLENAMGTGRERVIK